MVVVVKRLSNAVPLQESYKQALAASINRPLRVLGSAGRGALRIQTEDGEVLTLLRRDAVWELQDDGVDYEEPEVRAWGRSI